MNGKCAILIAILFFVMVISNLSLSAQVPQKVSYQSIIRNASGELVKSQLVGIRVSILQGSISGTVVYQETHVVATNVNGLFTIEVGGGTPLSGSFSEINWGSSSCFLKIETDPNGGTDYTITGTSEILSVPYALYANEVSPSAFKAPTATVESASNVQSTSATMNGIVNGNGFSTVVVFQWGTTTGYGNEIVAETVVGAENTAVSGDISGLECGATYHYRVKATNAVNVAYSSDMAFSTQTALAQLTTSTVSSISSTSAVCGGNISADGGATVSAYGVCWNIAGTPTIADSKTTDGTGSGSFTSTLSGLAESTTYYVRAYATNSVGTAYGNEVSFTTNPEYFRGATLNDVALLAKGSSVNEISITSDSMLTLVLSFEVAMNQPVDGDVRIVLDNTGAIVQQAELSSGVRSGDNTAITYTFDMHEASVVSAVWAERNSFRIQFSGTNLITNGVDFNYPAFVEPFSTLYIPDETAPRIISFIPDLNGNPYSTLCLGDKDSTDIFITWDEPVWKQTGRKLEIWRSSTNSIVSVIDASFDTTTTGDNIMRIPCSLFKGYLAYNESYYIHISNVFVKNAAGLGNVSIIDNDSLTFCVGSDPAPVIECGMYSPEDTTSDTTPYLTLTFSESVVPVSGDAYDVKIYRIGPVNDENDTYLHVLASQFLPVTGSNYTKWRLNTEAAFNSEGVHEAFLTGECYDVNIAPGAFRENNGPQVLGGLISNTINGTYTPSACPFTFCIVE